MVQCSVDQEWTSPKDPIITSKWWKPRRDDKRNSNERRWRSWRNKRRSM